MSFTVDEVVEKLSKIGKKTVADDGTITFVIDGSKQSAKLILSQVSQNCEGLLQVGENFVKDVKANKVEITLSPELVTNFKSRESKTLKVDRTLELLDQMSGNSSVRKFVDRFVSKVRKITKKKVQTLNL